ncbi:Putative SOS response-associated peptidase YedK [Consotaella salsifontis]|uniref:Abasic site processing protein n=2 Tax=Consotaella salsifontis TaxID=1365950 RepID=A0A1T4T745_9HYPH|nr:Putative SOS response-associated peptidase YedK [Consotaella salsifontis]
MRGVCGKRRCILDRTRRVGLIKLMCGRYALAISPELVAALTGVASAAGFPPRYNIAPSQPILIVIGGREERPDADNAERQLRLVRWGLVPSWVKDPKAFPLLFNARSESAAEKNTFRAALRYRRCLVPASGFYEWQRAGKRKQPFLIRPRQGEFMAFAGLMETWQGADGSEVDTAAILTTSANATLAPIHERMPVIVPPSQFGRWLDCRSFDAADVAGLMAPAPDDLLEAVAVVDAVNSAARMGPEVQTPVDRAMTEATSPNQDEPEPEKRKGGPAQGSLF